jgi:hypothetical protein
MIRSLLMRVVLILVGCVVYVGVAIPFLGQWAQILA